MSDEPVRRPEGDATTQPQPGVGEPPPGEGLTPEAATSAETIAAQSAEAAVPASADTTASAAAAGPAEGEAGSAVSGADASAESVSPETNVAAEAAIAAEDAPTTAEAVATIDAASDDGSKTETGSRRRVVGGVAKTLATVLIGLGLLVGGIALGNYIYLRTQAPPAAVGAPGTELGNPPPAAQEFIAALAINDADAVRSSLDRDPHLDLTRELTKYGIQRVDRVEVLGTTVDGPRSATEILMHYERDDGISFAINLVILVDGGKIEGFR